MKAARFEYVRPETAEHAVRLIGELGSDAKFIAGGQSLVPLMAMRLARPSHLVDIGALEEISRITVGGDGALVIGAGAVQRRVEISQKVREACPLLPSAISRIGHSPIRNRGTVGGSLAHADPAAELPLCAVALDAQLHIKGRNATRQVAASDFFLGPLTTTLEPDELLEEISIPALPVGAGWGFQEFSRRHGDFAIIAAVAILQVGSDGTISAARLALAGAGPTPLRARSVEEMMRGNRPGVELFKSAGSAVAQWIQPSADIHGSVAFRRQLSAVLSERALVDAIGRVAVQA